MEAAQRIRQNEKFALYYLPSGAEGWAECYVDFRRLVSVDTRMLRSVYPLRRLSEAARDGMMFQFFKYLTRREVNGANTTLVPPE